MLFVIEQSIYPYKIWVCDEDKEYLDKKFENQDGEFILQGDPAMRTFEGVRYKGKNNKNAIGALIWINKEICNSFNRNLMSALIAHEAIHATNMMFSYLGVTYTLEDDEHFAYFVNFVVGCILEVLYPTKKEK